MKLYSHNVAPNPRIVRMFLAEKDIHIPLVEVDIVAGESRREPFISKVNPAGQVPVLELDDGSHISEATAICEYFEDVQPDPAFIGSNAKERAKTRMWQRYLDAQVLAPLSFGYRFGEANDRLKDRIHTIPQSAQDFKEIGQENLTWLDGQMTGKDFVCGERFTLADISLFCALTFFAQVGQPLNKDNKNIMSWYGRVKTRPSTAA